MIPDWIRSIKNSMHQAGVNLFGITDGSNFSDLLPGCQTAIVFANGGRALWESFVNDLSSNPSNLTEHLHPLDDFVHRIINRADPAPPPSRRWIRCADNEESFIDFRPIAQNAGIGVRSHMGLLINPQFGLWVGIRAVLLTTESIPTKRTFVPSPCSSCIEKPCIASCLGEAVSVDGVDINKCAETHIQTIKCVDQCASRLSCPSGIQHRHSQLQHLYHSNREDGRRALAKSLKIQDNTLGIGLPWNDWKE